MVYKFRSGYSGKVSAQAAGEEIEAIRDRDDDGLAKPKAVVDAARPKAAVLHPCFEWNNRTAAELYREDQARRLIRSIEVVYAENETEEETREIAYVSVSKPYADSSGYMPTREAMANIETRNIAIENAVSELRGWRRRYEHLTEIAELVSAVDEAIERLGEVAV